MKSAAARSFAFAFVLSLIAGSAQAQLFGGFGNKQQNNDSELTVRIDRLESQIRQMTGTIEELQHRNQQLEQQLSAARGGAVAPAGRPQVAGPGPAGLLPELARPALVVPVAVTVVVRAWRKGR